MRRCTDGFILIDSLVAVFLVTCICAMCFSICKASGAYTEGYDSYRKISDLNYERIYRSLEECEGCGLHESD